MDGRDHSRTKPRTEDFSKLLPGGNAVEFYAVLLDRKPAQRGVASPADLRRIAHTYRRFGLYIARSQFKIAYRAGLSERRSLDEPTGEVIYYAAKDRSVVRELARLENEASTPGERSVTRYERLTRAQGNLLGYPDCCVEFFLKHHRKPTPRYLLETYRNTAGEPRWPVNALGALPIISHLPCSFDCPKSLDYAATLADELDWMIDPVDLGGAYLYFDNGCFVRLRPHADLPGTYERETLSNGRFGGDFEDSPLLSAIAAQVRAGALFRPGTDAGFYVDGERRLALPPAPRDLPENAAAGTGWFFVDFG